MKTENRLQCTETQCEPAAKRPSFSVGKAAYYLFTGVTATAYGIFYGGQTAFATSNGTTVWTKASEIMQDVYSQILLISTIAAVVTASIALLMLNFSRNERNVTESRAWLKRIIVSWAILNGLGFIMAYITPFFADGKWTA